MLDAPPRLSRATLFARHRPGRENRPRLPARIAGLRHRHGEADWCLPSTPGLRRIPVRAQPPDPWAPAYGPAVVRAALLRSRAEIRRRPAPARHPRRIGAARWFRGCAAGWVRA